MKIAEPDRFVVTLLENAQGKSDRASTIALSLLAALGFIWLGHLEPLVPKLQEMLFRDAVADHAKQQFSQAKDKLDDGAGDGMTERARVEHLRKDFGSARQELEAANREASIAFSIPGFPEFKVPREWAGLVWNFLLLGLVAFTARQRKQILAALDEAGSSWRQQYPDQALQRPTVLMSLPFWIAPLTPKPGSLANDARQVLTGWPRERSYRLAAGCLLVLTCVLQLRVCTIAIASAAVNPVANLSSRVPPAFIATICFLMLAATILICLDWLLVFPDQRRPFLPERRKLLGGLAAALVVGSVAAGLLARRHPETMIAWLKSPRYRRRPKAARVATKAAPGFYLNPRSNVVHHVCPLARLDPAGARDAQQCVLAGARAGPRRRPDVTKFMRQEILSLVPQTGGKSPLGRLPRFSIEDTATHLHAEGKVAEACTLLRAAILAPKPVREARGDVRLGYLLAKILNVAGDTVGLKQLVDDVAKRPDFKDPVRVWTDSCSRWTRRLSRHKQFGAVF